MKTTTLQDRIARLMPAGVPRYIRCYDNGGASVPDGTIDRYTVAFTGRASGSRYDETGRHLFPSVGMSALPFHPQGVGQHGECLLGAHLGRRIRFEDLPDDCRTLVLRDYREIWRLNPEPALPVVTIHDPRYPAMPHLSNLP